MIIDTVSSILANKVQIRRDEMSMALMKKQMQAEQAAARLLMEVANNTEQIAGSSTGAQGSIVDMYV
jgi:hypothetical protein